GVNRQAIAKFLDITPVCANPWMAAAIDGRVSIDFVVRCRGYFDELFPVSLRGEKKKSDAWLVAGQATQTLDEIDGQRFFRDVFAAIRVAMRDGIVEFAGLRLGGGEIYAREEFWLGIGGNGAQLRRQQCDRCPVSDGGGCQHQILQGTADSDVLFAQVGIEGADISLGVDIQLNRRIGYLEKPRLGIVRTGG